MSDSDDTDVLLLIPPNFFLIDADYNEPWDHNSELSFRGNFVYHPESVPFMSSQSELDSINARLAQIENDFAATSDISSIARCNLRPRDTQHRREIPFRSVSPCNFVHSTPKCEENAGATANGVLQEIDAYLNKKPLHGEPHCFEREERGSLGAATRLSDWAKQAPGEKEPLISLSEIWGREDNSQHVTLAEEALRRKHCERTIQALQTKLLEYQQKIAVAIDVDRKKDSLIQKHQGENARLKLQLQKLANEVQSIEGRQVERIRNLEATNASLLSEKELAEKEIISLRHLTNDLEEKNKVLESKLSQLKHATDETADVYKRQIADLEIRFSNSHHSKGQLEEQLADLRSKLMTAKASENQALKEREISAKELALRQEEIRLLQQQKQDALEKAKREKQRADALCNEKKSLDEAFQELKKKQTNVLKELESQRVSLKAYYQQQLEQVISKKLAEFQTQLDATEENLRAEAKEREKLIAERAIKQIELINTKNEQEIALIQQKNDEEVELYRIQLSNASKTIEELQEKLDALRSKRADIASKLHSIMESQWQKALEVLTSPSSAEQSNVFNANGVNLNKVDGVDLSPNAKCDNPENESFETPTSSRNRKLKDKRTEEHLQAYIQLLLNKSPRDLDNLEELLRSSKQAASSSHHKTDTNKSRRDHHKPPWK